MTAIVDKAAWKKITKRASWITSSRKYERDQEEVLFIEKFGGYKTEVKQIIEERERQALRNKVKDVKHVEIYGGLREDIGMKTHLHGPMDYAKKLKLRCRVGDLDLPQRRKIYTSNREEEDGATHTCSCGSTIESRTHIVGDLKYSRRNGMC